MNRTHMKWLSFAFAVFAFLLAPTARAQYPGYVTNSNDTGMPNYGSFVSTNIDHVNMANGDVNIVIPFVSLKGRGLNNGLAFRFESKMWAMNTYVVPVAGTVYQDTYYDWYNFGGGWGMSWNLASDLEWTEQIFAVGGCYIGDETVNWMVRSNWAFVSSDGSQHQLPLRKNYQESGPTGCGEEFQAQNFVAHTQTGHIKVDITNDQLNDHSQIKAFSEDGTQINFGGSGSYSAGAAYTEDTNGNQCCSTSSGSSPYPLDTLNRPIYLGCTPNSGYTEFTCTYYDSGGGTQTVTLSYSTVNIGPTSFPTTSYDSYHSVVQWGTSGGSPVSVLTKITLANGLSYTFSYDDPDNPGHPNPYGEITKITLPTGGYIKYKWTTIAQADPGPMDPQTAANIGQVLIDGRRISERHVSEDGSTEHVWTYSWPTSATAQAGGTITDPLGNTEEHDYGGCVASASGFYPYATSPPVEGAVVYRDSSGKLLKTVATDWACDPGGIYSSSAAGTDLPSTLDFTTGSRNFRRIRVTTTLGDTGQVTKTETDYTDCYTDSPYSEASYTECRDNPTEIREYDFENGSTWPLLRKTDYTYLHTSSSAYLNAHIWNRVAQMTVYDGSGTQMAQTQYSYDTTSITSTSGVPNHDSAYSSSNTVRGNPTVVSRWVNTTSSWLTTTNYYNDVGNLIQTTDPRGNSYYLSYTDNFTDSSKNGNSQAFLTSVTSPTTNGIYHVEGKQYYFYSGLTAAVCGQNHSNPATCAYGVTPPTPDYASYTYDGLGRPLSVTHGDGGTTSFTYTEPSSPSSSSRIQVQSTSAVDPLQNMVNTAVIDGLGRVIETQLAYPYSSCSGSVIKADTTYDALSRVSTTTNPYCSTSEPTYGITTNYYDNLSRVITLAPPDGSSTANNVSTAYYGNSVTVRDQAGKVRRSFTDGIGRLIEVDEPGGPPSGSGVSASNGYAMVAGTEQTYGAPGAGTVTISGSEQSVYTQTGQYCAEWGDGFCYDWEPIYGWVYDSGAVTITVNGHTDTAGYGAGGTPASIASSLASAINGDSSASVTATASGAVITLRAKTNGTSTDYSLSSSGTYDSTDFSGPSFAGTPSGSALTGGVNTYSDTGTVWINVGGTVVSVTYGSSSTASSIATALASAITADSSTLGVTASASSGAVNITENTQGAATSLSAGSTTDYPSTFAAPSFSGTAFASVLDQTANNVPLSLTTPAVTLYFYDGLNNLTCVEQHGNVSGTGCSSSSSNDSSSAWRVRRFTYDSLSRLLTSKNPESGTITNVYDSDSNCASPYSFAGLLVSSTDARSIRTCVQYDALNRPTKKTFSDGSTPAVTIAYDGSSISGCSPTLTYVYPIGRRTAMCDGAGWEAWSYDTRGRVADDRRSTNSVTKDVSYVYNYHGEVHKITYPSGRTVTYTHNAAGQATSAIDVANSITYAQNASYTPTGGLASLQESGTNLLYTFYYNNRLQPCRISVQSSGTAPGSCTDTTTGNVLDFTYNYNWSVADNGNAASISNNINTARSQSFLYDELNRISTAKTQATTGTYAWGLKYGYDAWANLLSESVTQGSAYTLSVAATGKNQLSGYSYDAAGNLLSDGTNSYTYNAENEIVTAAGVTYTYDGDGDRVQKSSGKLYWYGGGINPLAESDASGNINEEYIFFNGRRAAMLTISTSAVDYYVEDQIGSSRVITNSSGAIQDDCDFSPFGTETCYSSASGNHYKFTGKERDTETGLDDFAARFYSSQFGRFMSADDSKYIVPADPQTFNLYTYVANNPINSIDPTGHSPNGTGPPTFVDGPTAQAIWMGWSGETNQRGWGGVGNVSGTSNSGSNSAAAGVAISNETLPTTDTSEDLDDDYTDPDPQQPATRTLDVRMTEGRGYPEEGSKTPYVEGTLDFQVEVKAQKDFPKGDVTVTAEMYFDKKNGETKAKGEVDLKAEGVFSNQSKVGGPGGMQTVGAGSNALRMSVRPYVATLDFGGSGPGTIRFTVVDSEGHRQTGSIGVFIRSHEGLPGDLNLPLAAKDFTTKATYTIPK
jgi:RHS repeat-associated protein